MKQNLWLRIGILSVALVALITAASYLLRADGEYPPKALPDVIFFEDGSSSVLPSSIDETAETVSRESGKEGSSAPLAGASQAESTHSAKDVSVPLALPPWEIHDGDGDVSTRLEVSSRDKAPSSHPARPSSSRPQNSSREQSSLPPPSIEVIPPPKEETPDTSSSEESLPEQDSSEAAPPDNEYPDNSSVPNSQPPPSAPESSSKPLPPTTSLPDSSGDTAAQINRENEAAAAALAARYRVEIVLLRTGSYGGLTSAPEPNPVRMRQGLEEAAAALATFPVSFFDGDVTLVLAGKMQTGGSLAEKVSGKTAVFAVCAAGGFRAELTSRLAAFSADCFVAEAATDFSMLNPPGFFYGFPDMQYVYSPLNRANGYFLSENAQRDADAECRELMEAVLCRSSVLRTLPADCPLYTKMKLFCAAAVGWRGSLASNNVISRYISNR